MIYFLLFLGQFFSGSSSSHLGVDPTFIIADTAKYRIFDTYESMKKEILQPKKDEIFVVNFWATWCGPCIKELPFFEEFNQLNQNNNIKTILVSLDIKYFLAISFEPFIEKRQLKSELYVLADMDANKWMKMVDPSWSGSIPATLVLKGSRRVFTNKEMESVADIENLITQLTKE